MLNNSIFARFCCCLDFLAFFPPDLRKRKCCYYVRFAVCVQTLGDDNDSISLFRYTTFLTIYLSESIVFFAPSEMTNTSGNVGRILCLHEATILLCDSAESC